MRTLSGSAQTALAAASVVIVLLVEMDLTSTLYLNTSGQDIVYGGNTYVGAGQVGRIGSVDESASEIKPLSFTLNGVPSSQISLALSEPVQGRAVRVYLMVLDASTYAVLDVRLRWAGRLDQMRVADSGGTGTIEVTADNAAVDLLRPRSRRWTDADQKLVDATDTFWKYAAQQSEKPIVWPAASWGRR